MKDKSRHGQISGPSAEQLIDSDQLAPRNVAGSATPPPRDEISSRQGTHGGAADLSRYLAMLSRGQKKSAE
jgi:hypothetical protein